MRRRLSMPAQPRQRGAAALAVTMILLFCMTLVMFFVNRGLLFEQRTSANQYRSTRAFEVAEAGIEWATAMLNNQARVTPQCVPNAVGADAFRDRYAPDGAAAGFDFAPPPDARAGCRFAAAGLVCDCPAAGTAPDPDAGSGNAAFVVEITGDTDVPPDPKVIRLTSWGCINQLATCLPTATGGGDATAKVQVTLKVRPPLRAVPGVALSVGGAAAIGASPIINLDGDSNGLLVNAGGDITSTLTQLQTVPGTPVENALVKNDAFLSALAAADATGEAMFQAYFGTSMELFESAATTKVITGNSASQRGTRLHAAHAEGHRSFFVEGELDLGAGMLGAAADPVIVVSRSPMDISNGVTLYGLVFSTDQSWAGGTVNGAVLAAGTYTSNGAGITYDPDVLDRLRIDADDTPVNDIALQRGVLVRVPGSWRDFDLPT